MEDNSSRSVGRIFNISKNVCLNWIKKYAKTIKEKDVANEMVEVVEMDELYQLTLA